MLLHFYADISLSYNNIYKKLFINKVDTLFIVTYIKRETGVFELLSRLLVQV